VVINKNNLNPLGGRLMSASQSAVRSRAEAVKVSRTFDWMILFTLFFVVLGGYHIHYMLTGGDWDFWTDWKDRRLWVTPG
jgi:methane/ammonia monooxygenase subunit A